MSETKFTEEELASLRDVQQKYQAIQMKFGALSMQKLAHEKQAEALLEFLSSDQAQALYAELNMECPVKAGIKPSKLVQSWGEFKADPIPLEDVAAKRKDALRLVDKVQFDL